MKRVFLTLGLVIIWSCAVWAQPPNIIIIFTDDLGYGDLGCYGHPTIRTPHLDRMAEEGMRFTDFCVAAPVCTPSRAGLLTGRYPIRTGMVGGLLPADVLFPNSKTGLPLSEVTIAEVLKEEDYTTFMVGKWHLGHLPEYLPVKQGFDHYFGIPYSNDMDHVGPKDGKEAYWNVPLIRDTAIVERPAVQETLTRRYTEESLQFIERNRDRPFFLYLAHTMPHVPLFTSNAFADTSAAGLYGDVIEEIDWSVGQILEKLREEGLDENTLVLFTSDNGPWLVQKQHGGSAGLLKDGKGTTWEGGYRVPMIAWWPGNIPAGVNTLNFASTLDLLPTIANAAGADVPDNIDGQNILPILTDAGYEAPDRFFAYHRGTELFAARYGPWKAHFITQTKYRPGPRTEHDPPILHNLDVDPAERFNIADAHPDIVDTLIAMSRVHLESVSIASAPSVEGESWIDSGKASGGRLRIQDMDNFGGDWSGDEQLWWVEASPGDRLQLAFESETAGQRELFGFFTRARDYGIFEVFVNGRSTGMMVDGYSDRIEHTGPVNLGAVDVRQGSNTITLVIIGKDYRASGYSDGYLVGVDGFLIR